MHLINFMDSSKMFTFESITLDHPQNPHVFDTKSSSNLNFNNFWLLVLGGGESLKHAKNSSKHVQGIKHWSFLQDSKIVCSTSVRLSIPTTPGPRPRGLETGPLTIGFQHRPWGLKKPQHFFPQKKAEKNWIPRHPVIFSNRDAQSPPKHILFRFHYHSHKVIGKHPKNSLENLCIFLGWGGGESYSIFFSLRKWDTECYFPLILRMCVSNTSQ